MTYEYGEKIERRTSGDLIGIPRETGVIMVLDKTEKPYYSLANLLNQTPKDAYEKASKLVQATRIE